jgi:hypothetical protein
MLLLGLSMIIIMLLLGLSMIIIMLLLGLSMIIIMLDNRKGISSSRAPWGGPLINLKFKKLR